MVVITKRDAESCIWHNFKKVVKDSEYARISYDICEKCGEMRNYVLVGKRKATEGMTVRW